MAKTYEGDLPAGMVVLGLVIERPGETVSTIAQMLAQRFSYAGFADSSAYNTLPRYAKRGLVELVEGSATQQSATDRYAVTEAGSATFREWLRAVTAGPPVMRDALHGRMEFCRAGDLPFLIQRFRFERTHCTKLLMEAGVRLRSFERRNRDRMDVVAKVRAALLHDQALAWGQRVKRLERLVTYLETVGANSGQGGMEHGD